MVSPTTPSFLGHDLGRDLGRSIYIFARLYYNYNTIRFTTYPRDVVKHWANCDGSAKDLAREKGGGRRGNRRFPYLDVTQLGSCMIEKRISANVRLRYNFRRLGGVFFSQKQIRMCLHLCTSIHGCLVKITVGCRHINTLIGTFLECHRLVT